MDYFKAVGGLGLGSRLKRLSDLYLSEVRQLYAQRGVVRLWHGNLFMAQYRKRGKAGSQLTASS